MLIITHVLIYVRIHVYDRANYNTCANTCIVSAWVHM